MPGKGVSSFRLINMYWVKKTCRWRPPTCWRKSILCGEIWSNQGRRSLGLRSSPTENMYEGSEYVSIPRIMSYSFIQNCCWITVQVSQQGRKTWHVENGGQDYFLECIVHAVWFSLTKTKTKISRNEKIMILLTKTKTKTIKILKTETKLKRKNRKRLITKTKQSATKTKTAYFKTKCNTCDCE